MTTTVNDAAPIAQTFRLKTALLKKGRTHRVLASTKSAPDAAGPQHAMNLAIKCYAEGGENEFHTHLHEDHTFVVLQGRAIFHQPDQPDKELGRNEGILLPAGAFYKFESVPGEPLVLLRVGNVYKPVENSSEPVESDRLGTNGAQLLGHSKENGHVDGVPIEGAFYS
jgi:mannose-6-phosphate isomerase-like protein (cupin superfamily)